MARKRNRRHAAFEGTIAIIIIVTAVVLCFMFREHFAAAIVGVVGVVLGVAALIVGLIPLFSPPTPAIPPQSSQVSPTGDTDVRAAHGGYAAGRDLFTAGRDMNIGTDGSRYADLHFPMTPRERPADKPQAGEKSGE